MSDDIIKCAEKVLKNKANLKKADDILSLIFDHLYIEEFYPPEIAIIGETEDLLKKIVDIMVNE